MKNKIAFLLLIILICFISCDTITHYTLRIAVDRNPTVIIENQTGHPAVVTAPVSSNINHGGRTLFQPSVTNGNIEIIYKIGQIEFTEQATMNNEDITVTLTKRPPTITVINQTGRDILLTNPANLQMPDGETAHILAPVLNQAINITYRIGVMNLVEQINMRNQDITVTLTRRPPVITVVNNVGATINMIFLRPTNASEWTGGNITTRDGIVYLARQAQTGDIAGSVINGDRIQVRMEFIPLSGDRFDIRIDDVRDNTYVKSNVQIRNDMTLTFTAGDRR